MSAVTDAELGPPFGVETIELDLPPLAARSSRRLHDAGLPVTPASGRRLRSRARLVRPLRRRRLYWTARAVFVTDRTQVGRSTRCSSRSSGTSREATTIAPDDVRTSRAPPDDRPRVEHDATPADARAAAAAAVVVGDRASDEDDAARRARGAAGAGERRGATAAQELRRARPARARPAVPADVAPRARDAARRTRRYEKGRHGERIDMRRTLRGSLRTGGDPDPARPAAPAHRAAAARAAVRHLRLDGALRPRLPAVPRVRRRQRAERRGVRLRHAAHAGDPRAGARNPERAIQRAAAAAPDWSSGTRIGDALREFNDRHGRRGMARGAVVVILSDGWERGDPQLVGREMARLARLAHRIVWVNPRVELATRSRCRPAAWSRRCRTATRS